jgi:hypothetical protein
MLRSLHFYIFMSLFVYSVNTILILTVKNTTELRKLGTRTYSVKCKWENQAKKAEGNVGRGIE